MPRRRSRSEGKDYRRRVLVAESHNHWLNINSVRSISQHNISTAGNSFGFLRSFDIGKLAWLGRGLVDSGGGSQSPVASNAADFAVLTVFCPRASLSNSATTGHSKRLAFVLCPLRCFAVSAKQMQHLSICSSFTYCIISILWMIECSTVCQWLCRRIIFCDFRILHGLILTCLLFMKNRKTAENRLF